MYVGPSQDSISYILGYLEFFWREVVFHLFGLSQFSSCLSIEERWEILNSLG